MQFFVDDTAPTAQPFTEQPGPKVPPSCQTPEDCFSLFFDYMLLQYLVDTTNTYAQKKLSTMTISRRSLYRNWRPVTVEEMKGFIALILNMGIVQLTNIKDYWSTDDHPHTVRVVQTLVEPFHNKGYDLYVDRFYTSPLLASELSKVGITVTGTVQSNRRGLPKDVTAKRKKEPRGSIRAARSSKILALSWMDKRKVLMLSTKHNASRTQVRTSYITQSQANTSYDCNFQGLAIFTIHKLPSHICTSCLSRRGELKEKPMVVADYNDYMLGVDKLDQLMSYYSFLHKSVKWWRKIFFWLLEVMVINSYIIYKELARRRGDKPMTHLAFWRNLIQSLSEPLRSSVPPSSRPGPRASQRLERLQPVPHFPRKGRKRRDCSDRDGGTRHLTAYQCATCFDDPSLCVDTCFEAYHTQRRYRS